MCLRLSASVWTFKILCHNRAIDDINERNYLESIKSPVWRNPGPLHGLWALGALVFLWLGMEKVAEKTSESPASCLSSLSWSPLSIHCVQHQLCLHYCLRQRKGAALSLVSTLFVFSIFISVTFWHSVFTALLRTLRPIDLSPAIALDLCTQMNRVQSWPSTCYCACMSASRMCCVWSRMSANKLWLCFCVQTQNRTI